MVLESDGQEHGGLVQQILETQKELEESNQKKTTIEIVSTVQSRIGGPYNRIPLCTKHSTHGNSQKNMFIVFLMTFP